MINYDYITKENLEEHDPNWPQVFDHPYSILIIRGWRWKNKMVKMVILLIKSIYKLRIQMKQNINILYKKTWKKCSWRALRSNGKMSKT